MKQCTRLSLFFVCLLLIAVTTACAEGGEGLSADGERITGYVATSYGYPLHVDMPIPKERSSRVKQLKMQSMTMTQEETKKLLQDDAFISASDGKWYYAGTEDAEQPEKTFHFQEQNMQYTVPIWHKKACPLQSETATRALQTADATVRDIMDALNVSYEYPFYCVADAFSTLDTQSNALGLTNGQDVADYLLGGAVKDGKAIYQYYDGIFHAFDDDYVYVLVRLQADGIPFAYGDVQSPSVQMNHAPSNSGVFVQFQLTGNGQVTYADAANLQIVTAETAETRPLLSWQECLEQLCTASEGTLTALQTATLIRAELCYAINQRHITYPVWEFTIEISYGNNEFPYGVYPFPFYVDAITGECL